MSVASATGADGDGQSIDVRNATGSDDNLNSRTDVPVGNAGPSAEPKLIIQHYESESESVGEILDNIATAVGPDRIDELVHVSCAPANVPKWLD